MLLALIGAFALLLAAATACRRDVDNDGVDTLAVVEDTMPVGLWDTDTWDGRNERGNLVLDGVYACRFEVKFASGGKPQILIRKIAVIR